MANYAHTAAGSGDAALTASRTFLMGFSARETAGATASFILRDGTSASGTEVVFVSLGANESLNGDYGAIGGVEFQTGVYLDRVSGSSEITIFR